MQADFPAPVMTRRIRQQYQYCGILGKQANCQVLVSLTLAQGEVPVPIGLRLFLPDEWVTNPDRCAEAGVPEEHRQALAKTAIALRRSIGSSSLVHALAVFWPTLGTAWGRPSARA
jgi:hypothetical protein